MQQSFLNAALRYAELGYPVFPCVTGSSRPLTEHGFLDASRDEQQIRRWWAQDPDANLALSAAGLLVIDRDPLADSHANP
jgi:hypothetical protein